MDNPKEFWLGRKKDEQHWVMFQCKEDAWCISEDKNPIHVIEYSAYEQLQRKFEEALDALRETHNLLEDALLHDEPKWDEIKYASKFAQQLLNNLSDCNNRSPSDNTSPKRTIMVNGEKFTVEDRKPLSHTSLGEKGE